MFSSPFSGSGRWKKSWSGKHQKNTRSGKHNKKKYHHRKRSACKAAFDHLPDLDETYDMLSSGFSGGEVTPFLQLTRHIGNSCLCCFLNFMVNSALIHVDVAGVANNVNKFFMGKPSLNYGVSPKYSVTVLIAAQHTPPNSSQ